MKSERPTPLTLPGSVELGVFRRPPCPFVDRSERDANCNAGAARIIAVVQIISVIAVINVNIVSLVPVGSPVFGIGINETEPIATVLEARKPSHYHEGKAVDAERMTRTIVAAKIGIGNAVALVSTALLPSAALGRKAVGLTLLPFAALFAFLCDALLRREL